MWVIFCVMLSRVNGRRNENPVQFKISLLSSIRTWYYFRLWSSFSCSVYDLTFYFTKIFYRLIESIFIISKFFLSINFVRWKSVGLPHSAYTVILEQTVIKWWDEMKIFRLWKAYDIFYKVWSDWNNVLNMWPLYGFENISD